jgi:hypothetical protein
MSLLYCLNFTNDFSNYIGILWVKIILFQNELEIIVKINIEAIAISCRLERSYLGGASQASIFT